MAELQHIANMVNIEEGSKMFTRMRCTRCSETEAYVSNSKIKLLHTPLNFNPYAQSNFIKTLPEVKSGFGTLPKAAMFAGFGLYRKYLYKTVPKLYETDKCQVCKEGGSMECSLHFIFCDGLQLGDKRILGQLWIPPCDRPAKAGRTQKYGSKAKVKRPRANNTIIGPANKVLAGLARQCGEASLAGTSLYNLCHPFSSLSSWTVKQIQEFVSVNSFLEVYILQQIGNANLESRSFPVCSRTQTSRKESTETNSCTCLTVQLERDEKG